MTVTLAASGMKKVPGDQIRPFADNGTEDGVLNVVSPRREELAGQSVLPHLHQPWAARARSALFFQATMVTLVQEAAGRSIRAVGTTFAQGLSAK
jgi:hypothetical protein